MCEQIMPTHSQNLVFIFIALHITQTQDKKDMNLMWCMRF